MDRDRVAAELRRIVGGDGVVSSPDALRTYECDSLTYFKAMPDLVVLPRSTAEAAEVVRTCHRQRVPFIPRGSGTGLSAGALAADGGVVVAMTRMNRILEVDLPNRQAVVEVGLINLWLTRAVQDRGYFFAPDPASQQACTIGGNVANNAGGPHCLKYGATTNHILGVKVVLPDGAVVDLGGKSLDPPGYDLTGVFVGSEGTFGLATEATVRLLPAPEAVKTILAIFRSVDDAGTTVSDITARGILPAALEMIDRHIIRAIEAGVKAGYPTDAEAVLLIELDGPRSEVEAGAVGVVEACHANRCLEIRMARDEAERALLWKGRKEAAGAVGRITHEYYLQDAVVPRTKLAQILREIGEIGARHSLLIANVFHAGDGNLHPLICFDSRKAGELERAFAAGSEILRRCIALGGSITGEHGVGSEKMNFMPLMFTEDDLGAMKAVRDVFNPGGLCNPGKIFPTAKSCAEVGIAYRPHRIEREGLAYRL